MGVAIKMPAIRLRREAPEPQRKRERRGGSGRRQPGDAARPDRVPQRGRGAAKGATRKQSGQPAARRRTGLGWLNRLLILLGIGVVAVAALEAWIFLAGIQVERIVVKGELAHTRTEAVQDIVQPSLSGGFLGTDLGLVRARLEALPWIYEAHVRRVWPNALEIHVAEQLPIARWGERAFLNHEGQVFRPSEGEAWQSLPLLTGPENTAGALMATYLRLVDLLKPMGLRVAQLAMDDRGEIEAVLAGGQRLMIGGDEFLERMQRFTRLYRAELGARMANVERIDLRYRRGIAVAYRETPDQGQHNNDGA
jgi:cell division protein FtsQ